jgi:hypothetical protein
MVCGSVGVLTSDCWQKRIVGTSRNGLATRIFGLLVSRTLLSRRIRYGNMGDLPPAIKPLLIIIAKQHHSLNASGLVAKFFSCNSSGNQ